MKKTHKKYIKKLSGGGGEADGMRPKIRKKKHNNIRIKWERYIPAKLQAIQKGNAGGLVKGAASGFGYKRRSSRIKIIVLPEVDQLTKKEVNPGGKKNSFLDQRENRRFRK